MDKKHLQHSILETAYNSKQWRSIMEDYFGARNFLQQPKPISLPANDFADAAFELGNFNTADERLVGIYEVKLNPKAWIERNRVGLRSLLRQVYKYDVDAALIVFVQADKWRFSYVSEIRTEEGKKETEPKRYTYLFGKGEICRTAADRFEKLKGKPVYLNDLFEAFNVEKLNKEFFKTYKEFYQKGVAEITERKPFYKLLIDKTQEDEEKKEKPIRDFVKKMLGRIVFLHFLQKKGWMGVNASDEFGVMNDNWKDGDIKFLQNLFLHCPDKAHFLSKYLRILFFETLNTKRKNDLAPKQLITHNSSLITKVPYLNGGLFDKDNSFYNDIDFTAGYFKNLLEFFEQYNFTIDENDPYDNEVGIDPEMLGHIFENLLEENKDKGAFYTPKEVVHYMCQESLIQYLRTHLPECTEDESPATIALQNFIRNGIIGDRTDKKNFVVQQAKRIEKLLDRVKICDPAIGSGAFPMGMLQEIYKAKTNLDLTLDHTEVKKQIIQNCLYGVDIENGAVEIARLRFWLALVVDETTPNPLPNLDYKIMQGNSLLESFANIELHNLINAGDDVMVEEKLQLTLGDDFEAQPKQLIIFTKANKEHLYLLIKKYFDPDAWEKQTGEKMEKAAVKKEINDFVEGKIHVHVLRQQRKLKDDIKAVEKKWKDAGVKDFEKLNHKSKEFKQYTDWKNELGHLDETEDQLIALQQTEDKPYFLWHLWFKDVFDKGGFDIVIGNPPYIQMQKDGGYLAKILEAEKFETYERTGDIYSLFYENGINQLKKQGILTFITSNKWMRTNYGKSTRMYFNKTNPLMLIDFGNVQIFENATVDTNILILQKTENKKQIKACRFNDNYQKGSSLENFILKNTQVTSYNNDEAWVISESANSKIISKVREQGISLKDWDITINYGIKTGLNEAFIIDNETKEKLVSEDPKSQEILKPILRGKDIQKWRPHYAGLWLIATFPSLNLDINKYSGIKKFLIAFGKEKLVQDGTGRKKTGNDWFETQDQIGYWRDFEKPKIIYPNMTKYLPFVYDDYEHYYSNDKSFFIVGNHLKYLVSFFNSMLFKFCFSDEFPELQGGTRELRKVFFDKIPVKPCPEKENYQFEKLVEKILSLKKEKLPTINFENKIDALVFHLYNLTESEMLQVLDTFKDMSIKDRNQIQNEYWNIVNNKFKTEA